MTLPKTAGHVLISPKRVVPRFKQLSAEEVADLWQLAQRVGAVLEEKLEASSLTLAIQVELCHHEFDDRLASCPEGQHSV